MDPQQHPAFRRGSLSSPPRLLGLSLTLSLALHGSLALLLLSLPGEGCRTATVGAEALDIDLAAARLAPPLETGGEQGTGIGDGGEEGRAGRRGAGGSALPGRHPRQELARGNSVRPDERPLAREVGREQRAPTCGAAREAQQPRPPAEQRRSTRAAVLPGPRAESQAPALQHLFADEEVAAAAPPLEAVAAAKERSARRERLDRDARLARREREARAERWLAEMNAASRFRRGIGVGEGAASAGDGPGAGRRGEGGSAGRAPGFGLRFYLAGRPVEGTRVVRPPEAIELPRLQCRVPRLDITPATVRLLVVKDGRVSVAYVKHSSSNGAFDRCALAQARAIRFRPGHDGNGSPLDVWINLRVEPSTLGGLPM